MVIVMVVNITDVAGYGGDRVGYVVVAIVPDEIMDIADDEVVKIVVDEVNEVTGVIVDEVTYTIVVEAVVKDKDGYADVEVLSEVMHGVLGPSH